MTNTTVDVGYDEEQVNRSIAQAEDGAATHASDNAKRCQDLADLQGPTQWGTEPGALTFQDRYVHQLLDLQAQLNTLKEDLNRFSAGLRSCVAELQATDGDAKAGLDALKASLTPPTDTTGTEPSAAYEDLPMPEPRQES